jgi:hypothetical protein
MGRIWFFIGIDSEMCNAWNHSPSCTCGWGGEGTLSGGRGFSEHGNWLTKYSDLVRIRYRQEARAFVNPNAKCPICKTGVYFYQSPEGGRVFFDQLGKPWPKHPCTLNVAKAVEKVEPISGGRNELKPSEWLPFICTAIHPAPLVGVGVFVLEGLYDHGELKLFCRENGLSVRAPYLIKKSDESGKNFLVTTVQFSGDDALPLEFQATSSAIKFIPEQFRKSLPPDKEAKIKKSKKFVIDAKRLKVNVVKPKKPQSGTQPFAVGKERKIPTAMELAFEKAEQIKN